MPEIVNTHPEFDYENETLKEVLKFLKRKASSDLFDSEIYDYRYILEARSKHLSELDRRITEALANAPYFGRFDFEEQDNNLREQFYITKFREVYSGDTPVEAVSWRSPVADFWYQTKRHDVSNSKLTGKVFLRRRLDIKNESLLELIDEYVFRERVSRVEEKLDELIDPDKYLRKILGEKRGSRLKEIVETIEEEQNRIMRLSAEQILIIQGSAGTGKTTIALHRIGILTYQEIPNVEKNYEIIVIGPSKLFLNSISQILPSLNIPNIPQRTFSDWALGITGYKDIRVTDDTLLEIQDLNQSKKAYSRSKFKGSLRFREILEKLTEAYRIHLHPQGRVILNEGLVIYPTDMGSLGMFYGIGSSTLKQMINNTLDEPVNIQRDSLTSQLTRIMYAQHEENYELWLTGIKNNLISLNNFTSEQLKQWEAQLQNYGNIRNDFFITVPELQKRSLRRLNDELKKAIENIFKRYNPLDVFISFLTNRHDIERILNLPLLRNQRDEITNLLLLLEEAPGKIWECDQALSSLKDQYSRSAGDERVKLRREIANKEKDLAAQKKLLEDHNDSELEKQLIDINNTIDRLEGEVELIYSDYAMPKLLREEDIAPLLYVFQLFNGQVGRSFDHIIVDEAQDMSPFQMYLLRNAAKTASMTILGDTAQSIHSYRGIDEWADLTNVFSEDSVNYKEIRISYRSSFEITNFANKILKNLNRTPLAEPFERRGEAVNITGFSNITEEISFIQSYIQQLQAQGFKSIALVCRDEKACKQIKNRMTDIQTEIISILDELPDDNFVPLIPIYNAKGLEFEAVILINANAVNYNNDFEGRLLYVGATRALHRLIVTHIGKMSRFLV